MPGVLKKFFEQIDDIPNRGLGGCLWFCYIFLLTLKKEGLSTNSFHLVQYDYAGGVSTEKNISFLNGKSDTPQSSYHFTFMYEGKEYDCNGVVTPSRKIGWAVNRTVLPISSYEQAVMFCQTALKYGAWNDRFDKDRWIPVLEERFGMKF